MIHCDRIVIILTHARNEMAFIRRDDTNVTYEKKKKKKKPRIDTKNNLFKEKPPFRRR